MAAASCAQPDRAVQDHPDTLEIRRALEQAGRGGSVMLTAGRRYIISSTIVLADRQTLSGAPAQGGEPWPVLQLQADAAAEPFPLIRQENGTSAALRRLRIDGNRQSRAPSTDTALGSCLLFTNTRRSATAIRLEDLIVQNCAASGARLFASQRQGVSSRVFVDGGVFRGNGAQGLMVGGVAEMLIEDSRFEDNEKHGLLLFDSRGEPGENGEDVYPLVIRTNLTKGNGRHGITVVYSQHWQVVDNQARDNGHVITPLGQHGYGIMAGGGNPDKPVNAHFEIADNQCLDNYAGISVDPTLAGKVEQILEQHARVTGNLIRGAKAIGIHLTHVDAIELLDNRIVGAGDAGIAVHSSRRVSVSGGAVRDSRWGIAFRNRPTLTPPPGQYRLQAVLFSGNRECDVLAAGLEDAFTALSLPGESSRCRR